MKTALLFILTGMCSISLLAQQATSAAGGNATGSGGTVSYTVGQVFYTTNSGLHLAVLLINSIGVPASTVAEMRWRRTLATFMVRRVTLIRAGKSMCALSGLFRVHEIMRQGHTMA